MLGDFVLVFKRSDLSIAKTVSLDEIGVGFVPTATLDGNKITLIMQNPDNFKRKTYEFEIE
jgi:hypothetical protein